MSSATSLLETVQGLIERTYRSEVRIDGIGRFLIGDVGYRRLYASDRPGVVESRSGWRARLLVRETDTGLRACIYYPDRMIRLLEAYPPQRGLHDGNVEAFSTLVEELDHLLLVAERAVRARRVSLFELELHANVTKHLVLTRFLAGGAGRLSTAERLWLRRRLFAGRYRDESEERRRRYEEAVRWAVRFLDRLPALHRSRRLDALRRFHEADAAGKLQLTRSLAA